MTKYPKIEISLFLHAQIHLVSYIFTPMYAICDIETNGGNKETVKITEIAIFIFDGEKVIDEFTSLINPECHIPQYISDLTGITDKMVAHSPKFYEVARRIVEITENRVFIAHNVSFDYGILQKEFRDLGYNFVRRKFCSVELSRKYLPGHKSYSLGKLCDDLDIHIVGRHRAGGDALATVELFKIILNRYHQQSMLLF